MMLILKSCDLNIILYEVELLFLESPGIIIPIQQATDRVKFLDSPLEFILTKFHYTWQNP